MHVVGSMCFTNLLLAQGKLHIEKMRFFQNGSNSLLNCDSTICRTLKKKVSPGAHLLGKLKWAPGPIRGSGRAHFGQAGVVCVCGGCHGVSKDVLNDVFLRCVFERHDVKSQDHCSVLLVKTVLAPTQACSLRTHAAPIFSNIQRVPAILLNWQELDAERVVS